MKIYLTRYGQGQVRIVSMEAEDKGFHWDCKKGSAKLEFGVAVFFIPELVAKNGKDTFLSMEDAVTSLKRRIKRDITEGQKVIQGLYGQLSDLKALPTDTPASTIK